MYVIVEKANYVFTPGPKGLGTIVFSGLGFQVEFSNIVQIENLKGTRRRTMYSANNFTQQGVGKAGTFVKATQTLNFLQTTQAMDATDQLQIILLLTDSQASSSSNNEMNFVQYLDDVGDGTGLFDANLDYSGAPFSYLRQHQVGEAPINISELNIYYAYSGNSRADRYGSSLILTNGIIIRKTDSLGAVITDYTDQITPKINADWARQGAAIRFSDQGAGVNFFDATISYRDLSGFITLDNQEIFEVVLEDDLTQLNEQRFLIKGYQ